MDSTLKTSAIALAMGLSASGVFAAATASDTAANYAATWGTSAANLGSGFGAWGFTLNNANNPPYVGTYLDQTSYNNPDGVLSSGYAWGSYANGGAGDGSFVMARPFTAGSSGSASLYNQMFSVAIGSGGVGGSGAVGVNVGTAFNLSYNGSGSDNFLLSVDGGVATTLPVNFSDLAGGLQITLAVTGLLNSTTEGYTLTLSPFAGGPAFYTGSGTFDSASYNTSGFLFSDSNTSNDQFVNSLNITPEAVPEPSSMMLVTVNAVAALAFIRRRK
jgi:hypothetical protein